MLYKNIYVSFFLYPGSRMTVCHARMLMCLMILSLWISLPFMASFRKYKKNLPENEKRASIKPEKMFSGYFSIKSNEW